MSMRTRSFYVLRKWLPFVISSCSNSLASRLCTCAMYNKVVYVGLINTFIAKVDVQEEAVYAINMLHARQSARSDLG